MDSPRRGGRQPAPLGGVARCVRRSTGLAQLALLVLLALVTAHPAAAQEDPWEPAWPQLQAGIERLEGELERPSGSALSPAYVLWVLETTGQFWCQPGWSERVEPQVHATLAAGHALLERMSPFPLQELLAVDLILAVDLKQAGRFEEAAGVLEEYALPRSEGLGELRVKLLVEAAEIARRRFRWSASDSYLDSAQAELEGGHELEQAETLELSVMLLRAMLELERGLPDLALPWAERAEELAHGRPASDLARARFVRMRVLHLLGRFDDVVAAWTDFESSPACARLELSGGDERAWLAQLATRAAHAALELAPLGDHLDERTLPWLEDALAIESASADEHLFARSLLALAQLELGALDRTRAEIARAMAELPPSGASSADNRRLGLLSIDLLAALEAQAPDGELRVKTDLLEESYDELLRRWSENLGQSRQGRGLLQTTDRLRVLSVLFRAHVRLDGPDLGARAALELLVREQSLGTLSRSLGATALPTADLQRLLCTPRSGVLAYLPAHRRTHVFVISRERIEHVELPTPLVALDRARRRYLDALVAVREQASAATRTELGAATEALSAMLLPAAVLAPIESWSALSIVGDETLGYLPFEGLEDGSRGALGTRRALGYLPSLPLGAWLARERAEPRAGPVLTGLRVVCTAPAGSGPGEPRAFEPLPLDRPWLRRMRSNARPHRIDSLVGAQATLQEWTRAAPAQLDYLHVLAHGVDDPQREDPRGLRLADGSTLWGTELERMGVPATVVLTACGASKGLLRRGDDGRQRLSGACFVAGARTVVLPRLDVRYGATKRFSEAFERGLLRQGLGPAEAARRARVAMLAADPDEVEAHLMHVVGCAQSPLVLAREPSLGWSQLRLAGAGLVLLAAAAWSLRRRRRARNPG